MLFSRKPVTYIIIGVEFCFCVGGGGGGQGPTGGKP